ncbi:MAG TPA: hypothetical protein ENJ80_14210 [Gammaproteobacteria bacterium]|nr:hypothetical protein [Gammaproteobacteria bacterium]
MSASSLVVVLMVSGFVAFALAAEYYFYMDFTGRGWKQARNEFPPVAARLGLSLKEAAYDYEIGEISGDYRGYKVKVMPDKGARIELDMDHSANIDLDTDADGQSGSKTGFQTVNFDAPVLNHYFKTRFARADVAERLAKSGELARFIEQFRSRWGRQVMRLRVENGFIRCSFPHGRQRYIPSQLIEPILKDLADLADILKSL